VAQSGKLAVILAARCGSGGASSIAMGSAACARARLGSRANTVLTYRHRASRLILGAGIIGTAHHDLTIRDALEN
jgi:hypothetical protein